MMKRLSIALLVCGCTLIPAAARADDGGWLDWLFRMDMKLVGYGSEVHLLCLDDAGQRVRDCEDLWGIPRLFGYSRPPRAAAFFNTLKHEFDFRFAFYHKYGERFGDVHDERAVHAWRLMGMYYYHVNSRVAIGGGAGSLRFSGDGFDDFTQGIITVSVPVHVRGGWSVRPELAYLAGEWSGADLGNHTTTFSKNGELIKSIAIAYDWRRRH
jgi:hypothetical protein